MVSIAVIGYGIVGSGVLEVLEKHAGSIAKKAREEIVVKYILDLRDFPESPYAQRFVKDFSIIEKDPEISIVVECIGGTHPAYEFVKASLEAGKSVVTSNKQLVAEKGWDLLQAARDHGVFFDFEASVGGGVPIIRPMHQCLAANEITRIAGIVNGTTNFILSKMVSEGMDFDEALNLAMDLGYAERRDPSDDVDGKDACRKICILASLAFGTHVFPKFVKTEGIRSIHPIDMTYAKQAGYAVKLIARAQLTPDNKIIAAVSPAFVPAAHQLATVDDVFNGILVQGDVLGDVVFYGRGAGKLPTASAVVADVIDIVVNRDNPQKAIYWKPCDENRILDSKEEEVRLYVCCLAEGFQEEVIEKTFGTIEFLPKNNGYCAFISGTGKWGELQRKVETLRDNGISVENTLVVLDY